MEPKNLFKMVIVALFTVIGQTACYDNNEDSHDKVEKVTLYVSDETGSCQPWYSSASVDCMMVKEEKEQTEYSPLGFFDINGFEYERGYEYMLSVEKVTLANPPADRNGITYKLLDVVSKEPGNGLYKIGVSYLVDADWEEAVSHDIERNALIPWHCSYLFDGEMNKVKLVDATGKLLAEGKTERKIKSGHPDTYRLLPPDEAVVNWNLEWVFTFEADTSNEMVFAYDCCTTKIDGAMCADRMWLYKDWTKYYQEKYPEAGVRAVVCVQKLYWKGIGYDACE